MRHPYAEVDQELLSRLYTRSTAPPARNRSRQAATGSCQSPSMAQPRERRAPVPARHTSPGNHTASYRPAAGDLPIVRPADDVGPADGGREHVLALALRGRRHQLHARQPPHSEQALAASVIGRSTALRPVPQDFSPLERAQYGESAARPRATIFSAEEAQPHLTVRVVPVRVHQPPLRQPSRYLVAPPLIGRRRASHGGHDICPHLVRLGICGVRPERVRADDRRLAGREPHANGTAAGSTGDRLADIGAFASVWSGANEGAFWRSKEQTPQCA